jgi:exosortase
MVRLDNNLPLREPVFPRASPLLIAAAGLASVASLTYGPVLTKLAHDWWSVPDYAHGLICAPLALWMAWNRREELRRTPIAPRGAGFFGILASTLLLLLGTLSAELFLTRISCLLFIAATIVFVAGWRHLRILAFPCVLLLMSVPIPAIVLTRFTLPLQFLASGMAETALRGVGIPVLREGNVLVLPHATLQVAEACSGLKSLVSLITMALLIARRADARWSARVAIVLAGIPLAVAVNGLRVTITAATTYAFGPVALEGMVHEALGWFMFLLALVILVAWARGIARWGRVLVLEPFV